MHKVEEYSLYDIEDVALYVLNILSQDNKEISAMKLQKICFYIQSWYIAKNGRPLFKHDFQAWRYGPVSPRLYSYHRQKVTISSNDNNIQGNAKNISKEDQKFIESIVKIYGRYTGLQLSDMSHKQDPWKNARAGISKDAPSQNEIKIDSIKEYFSQFLNSK